MSFELEDIDHCVNNIARAIDKASDEWNRYAQLSQDEEKRSLTSGLFVPERRRGEVVGAHYQSCAKASCRNALKNARPSFDRLMKKAQDEVYAAASADEVASVKEQCRLCSTQAEYEQLYERYHRNGTLAKIIRSEGAKKRCILPQTLAEQVLENGEKAWACLERDIYHRDGPHKAAGANFAQNITW